MYKRTKPVYGVGVNDADYLTQLYKTSSDGRRKLSWRCPFYHKWKSMLERCYSEKSLEKRPAYKGVVVCKEWPTFSNFKHWMEQQDWEGKQLDKDLLSQEGKLYSPSTCCFIDAFTNKFLIARDNDVVGSSVRQDGKQYQAACSNPFTGSYDYLGLYSTPEEAHEAWRERKHVLAQIVAKTEADERVREALKKRYSKEEWYK